mmetsp:Transcript_17526/g.19828  ORF Transcript_17526/g.19828 Transcript_17526/m.19828 type:complete len:813 (+) Transcript_17526:34-2472(+)
MDPHDHDGQYYQEGFHDDGMEGSYDDSMQYGYQDGGSPGMDDEEYDYDEGEEDDEEEELDFSNNPEFARLPPLDQMRRYRREIFNELNQQRSESDLPPMQLDILGNLAATEYAEWLQQNGESDAKCQEICEKYGCVGENVGVISGTVLDEDIKRDHAHLLPSFMDAHGLLMEISEDRDRLLSEDFTHIGVGLSLEDENIRLVELFSQKVVTVTQIHESEDEGMYEVRGKMLDQTVGVYAARVYQIASGKEVLVVGPPKIQFDREQKDFIIFLDLPDGLYAEALMLELYVRKKPETIPYGEPSDDVVKVKDVKHVLSAPLQLYPDPRVNLEDQFDQEKAELERQRKEQLERERQSEKLAAKESRRALRMEQRRDLASGEDVESMSSSNYARSERSRISVRGSEVKGEETGAASRSDSVSDKQGLGTHRSDQTSEMKTQKSARSTKSVVSQRSYGSKADVSRDQSESEMEHAPSHDEASLSDEDLGEMEMSQKEMRDELELAINDMEQEHDKLISENQGLQKKVIQIRQKTEPAVERQTDITMNIHKYLNTLANVHQVRFKLKDTQEQYNKMAAELRDKLCEKQEKCSEIRNSFREFKREVCKNAEYSRTGKKISMRTIKDWEDKEALKDEQVQQARLENIRLRNKLAKNERLLKKKEELAEGLHQIDFEQLKIENQTLNEKIEERNEELHKFRKRIVNTVQILTHTKEKLQFVRQQNTSLEDSFETLEDDLAKQREILASIKKERDQYRRDNQRLKQQTGIVNSKNLTKDFDQRKKNIEELTKLKEELKNRHAELCQIVSDAHAIEMRNAAQM